MRNTFLLLILLSMGIALSAQQDTPSAPATFTKPLTENGCPVDFGAQVNSRPIARTIEDVRKHGNSPLLELTFGHRNTPKILGVTVTIHGLSSSRRFLPVSERSGEQRVQTFRLGPAHGSADLAHTEVWVTKMLFVRWAEVIELNYADGTTWHESPSAQCRAVPDLFHLVDLTAQQ